MKRDSSHRRRALKDLVGTPASEIDEEFLFGLEQSEQRENSKTHHKPQTKSKRFDLSDDGYGPYSENIPTNSPQRARSAEEIVPNFENILSELEIIRAVAHQSPVNLELNRNSEHIRLNQLIENIYLTYKNSENPNSYDRDCYQFLSTILQQILSLSHPHVYFFEDMLNVVLELLTNELEKLNRIYIKQLVCLYSFASKLPKNLLQKTDYITQLMRLSKKTLRLSNNEKPYGFFMGIMGYIARLEFLEPMFVTHLVQTRLECFFNIICEELLLDIDNDQSVESELDIRNIHLFWQYCVFKYGNEVYEPESNFKGVINFVDFKMSQTRYRTKQLFSDQDSSNDISRLEQRVFQAMQQWLPQGVRLRQQQRVGCYTLDITLPEKKILFDVFGPYHYIAEEIRPSDQFRHHLLEQLGWKIYIISYADVQKQNESQLSETVKTLLQSASVEIKKEQAYVPPHRRKAKRNFYNDKKPTSTFFLKNNRRQKINTNYSHTRKMGMNN